MSETRATAIDQALSQWPGTSLTNRQLEADLRRHGWSEVLPQHLAAVALCSACARGCEVACQTLDKEHLSLVRTTIARVGNGADFIDEVLQRVREKLLSGEHPKIETYTGRGPLMGWLRMVARRVALDLAQDPKAAAERPLDWSKHVRGVASTAEAKVLQSTYAPLFKQALTNVMEKLSVEERNMLRLQLVENLSVPAIAEIYSIHVATLYRRLERCHKSILAAVRAQLRSELGPVSQSEIQGLFVAVEAEIGLSLTRLLGGRDQAAGAE